MSSKKSNFATINYAIFSANSTKALYNLRFEGDTGAEGEQLFAVFREQSTGSFWDSIAISISQKAV